MATEPKEKIETLLKRYIKQRREKSRSEFELHLATRQMLHGEVSRTFAQPSAEKKKTVLFSFWPRFAVIGAITALFVVTLMVLNTPEKNRFAVAQSSPREQPAAEPRPTAADSSQKQVTLGEVDAKALNETKKFSKTSTASSPAKREVAAVGGEIKSDTGIVKKELSALAKKNPVPASSPAAADELSTRAASAVAAAPLDEATAHWRFAQDDLRAKYRRNLLSPAQPKVLQSFELTRNGNQIRIVEENGSVYEGEVLPVAQGGTESKAQESDRAGSQAIAFRVQGTSRDLNQTITFTGEAILTAASGKQKVSRQTAGALQLGDSAAGVIHGNVSIGGTNEFEIRAHESAK